MWDYSIRFEGFLVIRIQNVCGKAILMCLIPSLIGVKIMALSALRPRQGFSTNSRSERILSTVTKNVRMKRSGLSTLGLRRWVLVEDRMSLKLVLLLK